MTDQEIKDLQSNSLVLELRRIVTNAHKHGAVLTDDFKQTWEKAFTPSTSTNYIPREEYEKVVEALQFAIRSVEAMMGSQTIQKGSALEAWKNTLEAATQLLKGGQ